MLEDMQSTLHTMLSSQWDASCTCNASGYLLSSTPHLDEMIGGGQYLAGSELASLAVDSTDSRRLLDFLQRAALVRDRQALSLQCTFRAQATNSDQTEGDLDSRTRKVALYGIRLPRGATLQTRFAGHEEESSVLFIGIKANAEAPAMHEDTEISVRTTAAAVALVAAGPPRIISLHISIPMEWDTFGWDTSLLPCPPGMVEDCMACKSPVVDRTVNRGLHRD